VSLFTGGVSTASVDCPDATPNAVAGGFSATAPGLMVFNDPVGGSASSAATGWQAAIAVNILTTDEQITVYAICST